MDIKTFSNSAAFTTLINSFDAMIAEQTYTVTVNQEEYVRRLGMELQDVDSEMVKRICFGEYILENVVNILIDDELCETYNIPDEYRISSGDDVEWCVFVNLDSEICCEFRLYGKVVTEFVRSTEPYLLYAIVDCEEYDGDDLEQFQGKTFTSVESLGSAISDSPCIRRTYRNVDDIINAFNNSRIDTVSDYILKVFISE